MRDLWVWPYELVAGGRLNARTERVVYEGALVREGAGFGCVHCWPELGDPTLEECLADLAGAREFALVKRTVACLEADGAARTAGRSLFEGLEVPESHATLPNLSEEALHEAVERGFSTFKVKARGNGIETLREIRRFMQQGPGCWRVDFNEGGEVFSLLDELSGWTEEEKGAIDFLEDPVPYDGGLWEYFGKESGVALANDRNVGGDRGDSQVLVVKPAVDEMVTLDQLYPEGKVVIEPGASTLDYAKEVIVTSYMEHPVGQVFAAWEAARAELVGTCGLQTHGLFEPNEFTEVLGEVGPKFRVPKGPGLGFGDLLEKLPWTKLKR